MDGWMDGYGWMVQVQREREGGSFWGRGVACWNERGKYMYKYRVGEGAGWLEKRGGAGASLILQYLR